MNDQNNKSLHIFVKFFVNEKREEYNKRQLEISHCCQDFLQLFILWFTEVDNVDDVLGQHADQHGEGHDVDLDKFFGHLNDIIGSCETLDSWLLLLNLSLTLFPNSEEDEGIVSVPLNLHIIVLSPPSLNVSKYDTNITFLITKNI